MKAEALLIGHSLSLHLLLAARAVRTRGNYAGYCYSIGMPAKAHCIIDAQVVAIIPIFIRIKSAADFPLRIESSIE
jgi:hypothetical protein